jgi:hypothetical protein
MAKVTANLSVRGTTVETIRDAALEAIGTLGGKDWQITGMDLWQEMEDSVNSAGLDPVWRASVALEGNV